MRTKRTLLADLAYARSGDKGDVANVGVLAKDTDSYVRIKEVLTPDRIKAHFGEWVAGDVEVYDMANIEAVMIVLRRALGGGATTTLRIDQTGKAMANALLRMPVEDEPAAAEPL